jgi:uncharacterized protein (DUF2249 family)
MSTTVWKTLDARPILDAGEHPLAQVMADLAELPAGQAYDLLTPFVPHPLIDKAADAGYAGSTSVEPGGLVRTRFVRVGGA